jgi:hypothetical protein
VLPLRLLPVLPTEPLAAEPLPTDPIHEDAVPPLPEQPVPAAVLALLPVGPLPVVLLAELEPIPNAPLLLPLAGADPVPETLLLGKSNSHTMKSKQSPLPLGSSAVGGFGVAWF